MPVYVPDGTECPKCKQQKFGGPFDGGCDTEIVCINCGHKTTRTEARFVQYNEWRAAELRRSNHKPTKARRHAEAAGLLYARVFRAKHRPE